MQPAARVLLVVASVLLLVAALALALVGSTTSAIVLGLAGLAGLVAAASASRAAPSPRPHPTPPPMAVPSAADLDSLPTPFTACPRCGFLGVRFPGIRDGVWPGGGEIGGRFVCPRCDFSGIPIEFEDKEDYRAFLAELRGAA